MTDEQINQRVAEACGYKMDGLGLLHPSGSYVAMPDYCSDLNAMHEAEKTLSEDQMWIMARKIELNEDRWYFHASARERAEAFLRTLGKWEEVQG